MRGDRVAIIAPASAVKPEYIDGACRALRDRGLEPVVMPHAKGPADGSFAASVDDRLGDLNAALTDTSIKAILCARGGYGCVQLLPLIDQKTVMRNPKWLIGFSDISVLHALWDSCWVTSVHGPMAKHLTLLPPDDPCTEALFSLIGDGAAHRGGEAVMDYRFEGHQYNRPGLATGVLRGGNLAVLNGLAATEFDNLTNIFEETILFIEDISEPIYAVERMLMRLYLAGTFDNIKGLVIGQFTEYRPDRNHDSVEQMVNALFDRLGIGGFPVAFNFPTGHVDANYPLLVGDKVRLEVRKEWVSLKSI